MADPVDLSKTIEIRPYAERDESEVEALWRETFPDAPSWNEPRLDIRRKLSVQRELFLVATSNGAVVGTAMGGYDGHRGWVYYVAVRPGYRRAGIGAALMARLEGALEALGCPKLNLQVRSGNGEAVRFYTALGYEEEARTSMGKRLSAHELDSRAPTRRKSRR
jgi:ribosomal protein S18 acetylase RimI-like enzyme